MSATSATSALPATPTLALDGRRRLVLLEARRDGERFLCVVGILDGLDAPLYRSPETDIADLPAVVALVTRHMREALGERHADIVADPGTIIATLAYWGMYPDATLAGAIGAPLGSAPGDWDGTLESPGASLSVREVRPVPGTPYLRAMIHRLEYGNPRYRAEVLFGHAPSERRAAERLHIDHRPNMINVRELVVAHYEAGQRPDGRPGPLTEDERLVAELERENEALRAQVDELRAVRDQPIAMMALDRNAAFPKAVKPVAKAATFLYHQLRSSGKADSDGWVETSRQALAEACGGSPDSAGDQLARLAALDLGVHKRVEDRILRRVDDDGQSFTERRKVLLLKVDRDVVDQLRVFAAYQAPADADGGKTWGGKRTPCVRCGSTATRTVTYCADCGLILKETRRDGDEPDTDALAALHAESLPDEPRADAPSVPPTPITPVAPWTYPQSATGPVRVMEPVEEEPDDWDPYECNHRGCTRPSLPDKRYCDQHDPARLARLHRDLPPVAQPVPPPFVVHEGPPQGLSPAETPAASYTAVQQASGCARCGGEIYGSASHCAPCTRIVRGEPLHAHQRDPLALRGAI